MAEIAENLHRRELGEIERAELMAKWVEITAAKQEADAKEAAAKAEVISRQVGAKSNTERNPRGAGRKTGGIKQAAREIGVPEQTVRRAVKIAALAPEAQVPFKSRNMTGSFRARFSSVSIMRKPVLK